MEIFWTRKVQPLNIYPESDVDGFDNHGPLSSEVVEEGTELFENFMSSQIKTDIPQLSYLYEEDPKPMKTMELSATAERLRQLATTFSETDERRQVREMAMELDPNISGEDLGYLLLTMMSNNDNVEEGVIVVFFFCFDLVMRLLNFHLKPYMEIINMCKFAILRAVGPKVQEHGGWVKVIQSATESKVAMGIMAAGMIVVAKMAFGAFFH